MGKRKNIPGVLFTDTGIAVSQVERAGKGFRSVKSCHFDMPDGAGPKQLPGQIEAFRQFLKANGFKSAKAVVGISAKHVLGCEMDIPPLKDKSVLPGILKLGLEKKSMLSPDDVLIDYSGTLNGDANKIFVVSVLKEYVNSVRSFLEAVNITPLSMTLRSLVCLPDDTAGIYCGVYLWGNSAEIIVYGDGQIKSIQYLPLRSTAGGQKDISARLAVEMQRIGSSQISGEGRLRAFVVGDDNDGRVAKAVGQHENIEIVDCSQPGDIAETGDYCSLAGRLAWQRMSGAKCPIDFLGSHLNGKKESNLKRIIPRVAAACVLVIAIIGYLGFEWYMDARDVKQLTARLEEMSENVASSEEVLERVTFARRWFDGKTKYIDSLRELTLLFPEKGDVWISSLAVDESLNQVITGKAVEETAALDVLDKLEKSKSFTNVKLLYIRQTAKNTKTISFAINYQYGGPQR
ncbi:MAG: PilN domain-containing protein [Planctomycetes bacterium]|nr:PilN domain-containing protein [Planctomycetota bacterium]